MITLLALSVLVAVVAAVKERGLAATICDGPPGLPKLAQASHLAFEVVGNPTA